MTAEVKGLGHVDNEGGDGGVPQGHHAFGVLPVSGCILKESTLVASQETWRTCWWRGMTLSSLSYRVDGKET